MRWAVGDKVMAKWPGSSLYFHAEIKDLDEVEEIAEVLFEDGTLMDVEFKSLSVSSYNIYTYICKSSLNF